MNTLGRRLVLAAGIAGAAVAAQAPELAQQYRQRLGGAIEELQAVVAQFDEDASRNRLSREEALGRYHSSSDDFFRDRGRSMAEIIARLENLMRQSARMKEQSDVLKPVTMLRGYDSRLLSGAWRDFEPAVPVTPDGFAWSAAGFGTGALLVVLLAWLGRAGSKAGRRAFRRRRSAPDAAQVGRAIGPAAASPTGTVRPRP